MPAAVVTPSVVSEVDWWGDAVESGIESGVRDGAAVVQEAATQALQTRVDPWGTAFAPLSPTTIKLYASEGAMRSYASLGSSLVLRRTDPQRVAVRVTGKPRAYAFRQQFGDDRAQMFNNEKPVRIPARPALPMRAPTVVDVPEAMSRAILAAIRKGVVDAIRREHGKRARASR